MTLLYYVSKCVKRKHLRLLKLNLKISSCFQDLFRVKQIGRLTFTTWVFYLHTRENCVLCTWNVSFVPLNRESPGPDSKLIATPVRIIYYLFINYALSGSYRFRIYHRNGPALVIQARLVRAGKRREFNNYPRLDFPRKKSARYMENPKYANRRTGISTPLGRKVVIVTRNRYRSWLN